VKLAAQSCPVLVSSAQATGDKFEHAMLLFAKCHNMYNSAKYISTSDADDVGKKPHHLSLFCFQNGSMHLSTFRKSYRYMASPLPLHLPHRYSATQNALLEDHAVPFIKKWHTGFGFLGEQGISS